MDTGKIRFTVVTGILARREIRRDLARIAAEVMYEAPGSRCTVYESGTLFETEFLFVGTNMPNNLIEKIVQWHKRQVEETIGWHG